MAFSSPYGFDGTVTEGQKFADLTVHPSNYGVGGFLGGSTDCRVTIVSGVDRTVRVATGYAYGKGVAGYNSGTIDIQLNTIGSGSRWDTIVLRRDLSTNGITALAVAGTSTQALAPGLESNYTSNKDDQPIALARVTAGQSNVQEVIDLRVWAANGGLVAVSEMVKDYLTTPGTQVRVGNKRFTRTTDGVGAESWSTEFLVTGDSGWLSPGTWGLGYGTNSSLASRLTTDATGDWVELKGFLQPANSPPSIPAGRTGPVAVLASGHAPTVSKPFPAVRFVNGASPEYKGGGAAVVISNTGNVYIDLDGVTASAVHVDGIRYRKA